MSTNMVDKLKRQLSSGDKAGVWTSKRITASVIFGAICLVFVFFGLPGKMGAGGIGAVARVNNTLISVGDFQQEEKRVEQYYASLFGGAMDLSSQRQLLQQQAIENLVRMELVSQAAEEQGILATDAEVRDFIVKDVPIFQQNGLFQRDLYLNFLEGTRATPAAFESKMRKNIQNLRVRRLFEIASRPTALEEAKIKTLKETKLNVAFAKIDQDQVLKNITVADSEVSKALSDEALLKKAKGDFEANKANYEQKESVHAQHILISFKQGDAASEAAALKKIQDIRKSADKEDFGKLAEKWSEDPGSKSKKGDLGFFERGRMVKEFETVAFAMAKGKVSEPVKSPFGYHLIKVLDKQEAQAANFDTMKNKVVKGILAREKYEATVKNIEEALAKKDESKVSADLKTLGVSWDETGFFELGADSVPKFQSVVARDSMNELTEADPLLKRLVREGNFKYILKLKGVKHEVSTDTAKDQSTQRRKAEAMYDAWLNQYRKASRVEMNSQIFRQN